MGLHAIRQSTRVLPFGHKYYVLWLSCGHTGGVAKPGSEVKRRKCHTCGIYPDVARIEPCDE